MPRKPPATRVALSPDPPRARTSSPPRGRTPLSSLEEGSPEEIPGAVPQLTEWGEGAAQPFRLSWEASIGCLNPSLFRCKIPSSMNVEFSHRHTQGDREGPSGGDRLKSVEATRDQFDSMAQAVFRVLESLETGPSSGPTDDVLKKLRVVPTCMLEEMRDSAKATACQAFTIVKSLYPRVDIATAIEGFATDCNAKNALERMNDAREATDGVVRTMDLQQ
uniref:Uncharacterized protein n=1 Tax=Oryza brachyantha TaxID=4533 RepID=J3L0T4_ORYBR